MFSIAKVYYISKKGIKTRKVGGIDIKIANILLKINNGFSVKGCEKVCTKLRKLSLKIAIFYRK